jgi:hypothetical protein
VRSREEGLTEPACHATCRLIYEDTGLFGSAFLGPVFFENLAVGRIWLCRESEYH